MVRENWNLHVYHHHHPLHLHANANDTGLASASLQPRIKNLGQLDFVLCYLTNNDRFQRCKGWLVAAIACNLYVYLGRNIQFFLVKVGEFGKRISVATMFKLWRLSLGLRQYSFSLRKMIRNRYFVPRRTHMLFYMLWLLYQCRLMCHITYQMSRRNRRLIWKWHSNVLKMYSNPLQQKLVNFSVCLWTCSSLPSKKSPLSSCSS